MRMLPRHRRRREIFIAVMLGGKRFFLPPHPCICIDPVLFGFHPCSFIDLFWFCSRSSINLVVYLIQFCSGSTVTCESVVRSARFETRPCTCGHYFSCGHYFCTFVQQWASVSAEVWINNESYFYFNDGVPSRTGGSVSVWCL